MINWDWIAGHLDDIVASVGEHLVLTVVAVAVGLDISFVLAIVAHRLPVTSGPITAVAGLLYTIPSLALFALLVPVTGFSLLTAEIGLISYTLLILIRNIVAGLESVPPEVLEAADAMGFGRSARLVRVELPLALPIIVAGVRIATVTTVGLVTVTAVIGQGGLGQQILLGFQLSFPTRIYVGAVLSVVIALFADGGLAAVERLVTPWARARASR